MNTVNTRRYLRAMVGTASSTRGTSRKASNRKTGQGTRKVKGRKHLTKAQRREARAQAKRNPHTPAKRKLALMETLARTHPDVHREFRDGRGVRLREDALQFAVCDDCHCAPSTFSTDLDCAGIHCSLICDGLDEAYCMCSHHHVTAWVQADEVRVAVPRTNLE